MTENGKTHVSKFLSLVLRHKPEAVGISLEKDGWVETSKLITACAAKGKVFTMEDLIDIVKTDSKTRYAFNEDKSKIRANQGHTIEVKLDFECRRPPEVLYHGTFEKSLDIILKEGLSKMSRHHVHLSENLETARAVGARRGRPVILEVASGRMDMMGFVFSISANGVWLVDYVPPQFLKILD
jgi:putative RNA 2'-phosphotransferase